MKTIQVLKSATISNLDFTGTKLGKFQPSDEEESKALEIMKRMTAKFNTEQYLDQIEACPQIEADNELKNLMFTYAEGDFLSLRQLGPRPEDMLYLGAGSEENADE
jgi:hypothetical protein